MIPTPGVIAQSRRPLGTISLRTVVFLGLFPNPSKTIRLLKRAALLAKIRALIILDPKLVKFFRKPTSDL
jgi:hypothetical protein